MSGGKWWEVVEVVDVVDVVDVEGGGVAAENCLWSPARVTMGFAQVPGQKCRCKD